MGLGLLIKTGTQPHADCRALPGVCEEWQCWHRVPFVFPVTGWISLAGWFKLPLKVAHRVPSHFYRARMQRTLTCACLLLRCSRALLVPFLEPCPVSLCGFPLPSGPCLPDCKPSLLGCPRPSAKAICQRLSCLIT